MTGRKSRNNFQKFSAEAASISVSSADHFNVVVVWVCRRPPADPSLEKAVHLGKYVQYYFMCPVSYSVCVCHIYVYIYTYIHIYISYVQCMYASLAVWYMTHKKNRRPRTRAETSQKTLDRTHRQTDMDACLWRGRHSSFSIAKNDSCDTSQNSAVGTHTS